MFGIDPKTGKRVEGLEAQLEKGVANLKVCSIPRERPKRARASHGDAAGFGHAPRISQGARNLSDPDNGLH